MHQLELQVLVINEFVIALKRRPESAKSLKKMSASREALRKEILEKGKHGKLENPLQTILFAAFSIHPNNIEDRRMFIREEFDRILKRISSEIKKEV